MAVIVEIVRAPEAVETIVGALASILIAGSVFFSALWDTVKDFIQYYDFRARREKDKIYIRYGFFKKVGYTIPVDKIQALKIHQTWFARIAGRYMVEVVNVGMNDEAGQKAFLVLYSKKEQLKETLHTLLPEFVGSGFDGNRQTAEGRLGGVDTALWYLCSVYCDGVYGMYIV